MSYQQEINKESYPKWISLKSSEDIIEQMKSKVCKIVLDSGNGTGFFCKIPFPSNKLIPVLITNNHVINKTILDNENINIYYSIYNNNSGLTYINLKNRMKYTSEKYDITIIELKENDNIKEYLEIELNQNNIIYNKKSIYLMHYPGEENISVSYGIINNIKIDKLYEFIHYCSTEKGSSGSPILDISNNKIIGIHKGSEKGYNLGTFINYPINEFIEENSIDKNIIEFNKKFNLNINNKTEKLDLRYKGNECIKHLENIKLIKLKELNLNSCNISDIGFLEKIKFEKLEKLDLGFNKISNIEILEKVNLKELKELYLYSCNISDIGFLEKIKFEKLEKLYLCFNKISNIEKLEKVNLKILKELNLVNCNISDIGFLEKIKFEKLEKLDLGYNNISNLEILEKVNLKELKELYLVKCNISDIGFLEKIKFEKLEKLYLQFNKISNIEILEKVNLKELKELYLY